MKIGRYIFFTGVGVVFGIIAMAIYITFDNFIYPDPWIVIHVKNDSSQDVVGMSIKNENGSVEHVGIQKGQDVRVPVSQFGEGNYTIQLTLQNGAVCGSEIGYIESGSKAIEWVTDEGVINDVYKRLGYPPNKCAN